MPGPVNGLKNALQARQEALQAATGGMPMPSPTPQATTPLGGLQAAGPRAETPRLEMNPADRAQFTQDTGIAPNPGAMDTHLPGSIDELLKRAYALTGIK